LDILGHVLQNSISLLRRRDGFGMMEYISPRSSPVEMKIGRD